MLVKTLYSKQKYHRNIKLVTTNERRNKLASEPNYHSTEYISKDLLVMEMRKTEVRMNKPIYLDQAIVDLSKTLMFEVWYDYIKPKFGDKAKLRYMDTDSFVMYIETEDFYKDISVDVDRWFDTSNFNESDNRPLEIRKNKKGVGKFKDELGGKILTEFCALRAKAYAYKLDDDTEKKKAKGTKKCIVKREIIFKSYLDALFNDEVIIKSQQRFRSDHHKVYTEEINKIALSSNDDKRTQTFDKVTTYPYGTNIFMTCENEMLSKNKFSDKLNNESQVLRIKSQELRNDAQSLRNESQELRNELKELRNKSQELRNKFQVLRNEAEVLRNESQKPRNKPLPARNESKVLRNKSQKLRNEAQIIRNESLLVRNELHELGSKSQELRNKSQVLRNEAQVLRNEAQIHKNKSWIHKKKSQVLREKLQDIRSEARAIRNESFLATRKSENLRSEAEAIRISSEVLRLEAQALRSILFKSDEKICMPLIERNITFDDLEDALDTTS